MTKKYTEEQQKIIDSEEDQLRVIAAPGSGKCEAPGTLHLMFDGTIKKVEDLVVGDVLMGPDSKKRTITSVCSGEEEMFEIVPTKGESFTVNRSHILSLKMSGRYDKNLQTGHVVDISINDYLKTNKHFRHRAKLWRTGVDFQEQSIPYDPYVYGYWLGDGHSKDSRIYCAKGDYLELNEYFTFFAQRNSLLISYREIPNRCGYFSFRVSPKGKEIPFSNKFRQFLVASAKNGKKKIDQRYLINSRENRLKILAGLLDSDGSLSRNIYDFISVHEELANQVCFLARSLGFAAYKKKCKKTIKRIGFSGTYYRISISGDTSGIPCLLKRKQASKRAQAKSVLVTGFKLKSKGVGTYYGFTLKEEPHYLLADFTVSHNTTTLVARIAKLIERGFSPEKLFILCFAKHDKTTIVNRLTKVLPYDVVRNIRINNYHSYGLSLIRQYGLYERSGPEIKLLEEHESKTLIKKMLENIYTNSTSTPEEAEFLFKMAKKVGAVEIIFSLLNTIRDQYCLHLINLSESLNKPENSQVKSEIFQSLREITQNVSALDVDDNKHFNINDYSLLEFKDMVLIAETYAQYLKKHGYVDFTDMILQAYYILKGNPHVLEEVSGNIEQLLVDEFQDISPLQFEFVSQLSSKHNRIFGVGDIDQTVYQWRNASPYLMKDVMPVRYPRLVTLPLSINFRSDSNIVEAASNLIVNNKERLDLKMKAFHPAKNAVSLLKVATVMDQADKVASLISEYLGSRSNYYVEKEHKVAIILRSARSISANLIRNALFKKQIPVQLRFESKIIEKIMTVISAVANLTVDPRSPVDFITVMSILPGFGEKTIDKIRHELNQGLSLSEAIKAAKIPNSKAPLLLDVQSFIQELHDDYIKNENITLSELDFFGRRFDLAEMFRKNFSQGKGILENTSLIETAIEEIQNSTEKFIDYRDTLTAGLSALNRTDDGKKPAVLLCTSHYSKGQEYEMVICPDLIKGSGGFPAVKVGEVSEEERRIFYVAITRAIKQLYLITYDCDLQRNKTIPSPYIRELQLDKTTSAQTNYAVYNAGKSGPAINPLLKRKSEDYE